MYFASFVTFCENTAFYELMTNMYLEDVHYAVR